MSNYSVFKKRRNNYNHTNGSKDALVEKWFQERRQINSLKDDSLHSCHNCHNSFNNIDTTACCTKYICSDCIHHQKLLYNRCIYCNTIIDTLNYYEYDGYNFFIPSYDDFFYLAPLT